MYVLWESYRVYVQGVFCVCGSHFYYIPRVINVCLPSLTCYLRHFRCAEKCFWFDFHQMSTWRHVVWQGKRKGGKAGKRTSSLSPPLLCRFNCMIYCFDEIACKQFSGWLAPKAQVKSSHPSSLWTLQRLYLRLNMAIFHGHKQVAKLHSFEVVQGLWKISASWWIILFNHFLEVCIYAQGEKSKYIVLKLRTFVLENRVIRNVLFKVDCS